MISSEIQNMSGGSATEQRATSGVGGDNYTREKGVA